MERTGRGFTLIELLMVMLIIGIVIAMLMKIGPEVSRNIKVHLTQNFIHVLDIGAHRYRQIRRTVHRGSPANHKRRQRLLQYTNGWNSHKPESLRNAVG